MPEEIPQNDLPTIARSRVIEQYRNSPRFLALLDLFGAEVEELQEAIFSLLNGFDLFSDENPPTGWALDVIGKTIGLPRPRVDASVFGYFGYAGATGAESYGDATMPEVGGRYVSVFSSAAGTVPLEDNDYLLHLRAKVLRNYARPTTDLALEIIDTVLDSPGVCNVIQDGIAGVRVVFGRNLSTVEKQLFKTVLNARGDTLIPEPQGVAFTYEDPTGAF